MAVFIPRARTLGVRLSEEEFSSLEKFCLKCGARSMSDLARTAICSFVLSANQEGAIASTLSQNVAQVRDLQQRIEILAVELALLKANASGR